MRVLILSALLTVAAYGRADEPDAAIHKGDWEMAGGLTLSSEDDTNIFPFVLYYLGEDLGVGLQADYYNSPGFFTSTTIGPAIKYYFAKKLPWAFYVSEVIQYFSSSNGYTSTTFNTSVGVDYFVTRNVAFGPHIEQAAVSGRTNKYNPFFEARFSVHF